MGQVGGIGGAPSSHQPSVYSNSIASREGDMAKASACYFDDTWEGVLRLKHEEKEGTFVSCGCQVLIYTNNYI